MKQYMIASQAGITQKHLSNIVTGRSNASQKTAVSLGKITESDPAVFVFGSPQERKAAVKKTRKEVSNGTVILPGAGGGGETHCPCNHQINRN